MLNKVFLSFLLGFTCSIVGYVFNIPLFLQLLVSFIGGFYIYNLE
jgi:hypothetical protein